VLVRALDSNICPLLMSVPEVGASIAVTVTCAVDDLKRFSRSGDVGTRFGLTLKKYRSSEIDIDGAVL
jgi:transposase